MVHGSTAVPFAKWVGVRCSAGLLGTASSVRPSRHKDDSDRGSKHRLRAHSHRAAHHRAALAAALVGTAQSHQTGVNPHRKRASISSAPPEKCGHGSISFIKCWLDPQGFVRGLSFESKLGTKAQSLCSTEGKHQEEAFLYEGETILDIVACRWVLGAGPGDVADGHFMRSSGLVRSEAAG